MDTVAKYRAVYGLTSEIGSEHLERHRQLEERLTRELLASSEEERWQVFSRAYTELYVQLPWLNQTSHIADPKWLAAWSKLIPPGASVFEIGSGKAQLLSYLLGCGHRCVATEITPERGSKHLHSTDGLDWHTTDGVNLARFEKEDCYDVVISTQVMEHFHPEDVPTHMRNALAILKPGGHYIFDTPHRSTGPHDLSRVFDLDEAMFMHLKEFDFRELRHLMNQAGFSHVRAVFSRKGIVFSSALYLAFLCAIDAIEPAIARTGSARRSFRRALRHLVPSTIWIAGTKPQPGATHRGN